MARQINITPRASQDIDDQFNRIAQDDFGAALRFFDAVRQTIAQLARMPGMGTPYPLSNAKLVGLRRWPVKGFSKQLIFYLTDDNQIQILRVLHASRDIPGILDDGV
ncbi:MAG: type II toxin-antitoxin system RelE/ParE family toxin [Synechococcales cyanobacterium RU_4_20]|nr:type II toxin-antitoxin system RelE/ParE family toxin [Synechococcales cyanobacterium RU_4_20]NJR70493.1 type II toxin-antitoxin system RelE/ParE family toxin [Synechococcales cyanobacterium CRU_2_2]